MLDGFFRTVQPKAYTSGDQKKTNVEESLTDLKFHIHKFNNRPRPAKNRTLVIPMFTEFGCETLGSLYVIPKLIQEKHPGRYVIIVGWHGREYLYRHLADEYWELNEEFQYLREYCRAFHHESRNLFKLEEELKSYGQVVTSKQLGNGCVMNECFDCMKGFFYTESVCPHCKSSTINHCLFGDVKKAKEKAQWFPPINKDKLEEAEEYLKPNSVGITARARKCYGRNLSPLFYERLIYLLEDMGYNPIWLGEKQTTLPCPLSRITDLTRSEKARDLEFTLAIVSKLKFTVQFWTASTRLAGLVGTPYLLFESPEQIWGRGQEGMRLFLGTKGDVGKIVVTHYNSVVQDNSRALRLVKKAVLEMEQDWFKPIIGMVENADNIRGMIKNNAHKIGA